MSEKRINMEHLSLQHNEVVAQDKKIVQVVEEAYQMVLELAIQVEEPVEVRVWKLVGGVRKAKEEMARVQQELNLQIVEIQLKV